VSVAHSREIGGVQLLPDRRCGRLRAGAEVDIAEFVHELLTELWAALFEEFGANSDCVARGTVAQARAAELGENGNELDRRFSEAVTNGRAGPIGCPRG
jgi:hypothetical protein